MKKLLLVFASLFLLTACGDKGPITSDDGRASLEIPEGALPEDVERSDISVTADTSYENAIVYELEPDGTEFLEDLSLTVDMDYEEGVIPQAYLFSDGELAPIRHVEIIIDVEEGKTTLIASIPHFSKLYVDKMSDSNYFSVEAGVGSAYVGEPVVVTAKIKANYEPFDIDLGEHGSIRKSMEKDSLTVEGEFIPNLYSVLEPHRTFKNRPPRTLVGDSYTLEAKDYHCGSEGAAGLDFKLFFRYADRTHAKPGSILDDFVYDENETFIWLKPWGFCDPKPRCGDGVAGPDEQCDGIDFKGKTCLDFGFKDRNFLWCKQCEISTERCKIIHDLSCNENTWEDETGDWEHWTCQDDCPEGQVCNASCVCEEKVEKEEIMVILYLEHYIPVDQVHQFTGDECDKEAHWHANGPTVTTTKGVVLTDPESGGCGFGKVSSHPAIPLLVPKNRPKPESEEEGDFEVRVEMGF